VFGFSSPSQEGGDILGNLTGSGWCSIRVLHNVIVNVTSHGNGTTREIFVVLEVSLDAYTGGWIRIAGEEGEDVIVTIRTGFGN